MADLMELARAAARSRRRREPVDADLGYTTADLEEMDRLLRELAQIEGWSDAELAELLGQRRRMAPINVPAALHLLRAGAKAALAVWPEKPAKRAPVVLCVIHGRKQ